LRNAINGVSAIFDINSDAIGLPAQLFTTFVGALNSNFGVSCAAGAVNQPVCTYSGEISSLPTVNLEISSGAPIVITPAMYTVRAGNGGFTLNVRALAPSYTGVNFINSDWANTIVLGNTILGHYYTYFNLQDSSVNLYQVL